MRAKDNLISGKEIVSMIDNNHSLGWESLYDMYAPMMYGAILQLTDDEKVAENILVESFAQLNENMSLLQNAKPIYMCLLHHTYLTAKKFLNGTIKVQKDDYAVTAMFPVVNCLLHQPCGVRYVEVMNGMSKRELRLQLHEELKQIRNKNKYEFKLHAV